MESLGIIRLAGVVASAVGLFLLAFAWAARQRRRRVARGRGAERAGQGARVGDRTGARTGAEAGADFEPVEQHRLELRLATLEQGQAGLAARLDGAGGAEERLQATAGQLLGLVRDKNATLETALAGLDQLRSRMRTLEQIGDAAEARGLFERLGERLAALESAQAAHQAATQAATEALAARAGEAGAPQAALVEQLTRLYAQKDATVEAVLARLGPVEARLGRLEGEAPAEALARLELRLDGRLDGLRDAQGATQAALTALKLEGTGPVAEIAERLTRLHAQKDALAERLLARLAAVESELAARDPANALDGLAERLEALRGRVALLETPQENPYAGIVDQLTTLYAQKDAATETMLARLAPLEARLGAIEARDPADMLDALRDRLVVLETPQENPYAGIADQLTTLYAQKDAAAETVLARLAPLEARLGAVEARDPADMLDALRDRLAVLETPQENPYAGIADQLTTLYAQKDAATEAMFTRLAPLEARLGAVEAGLAAGLASLDPQAALDALGQRLEAAEAGLRDRLAALETKENPYAEIAGQLTTLYAQKDAVAESVFTRLGEVEAGLAAGLASLDPQAALDALGQRLEAAEAGLRDRLAALETKENPYAEIAGQLTTLYAQKDAVAETVLARLAPLEAQLGALEASPRPSRGQSRGRARGARPAGGARRPRRAAGGGAGAARGGRGGLARPARRAGGAGGEPLRRNRGAADRALRPEGRRDRGGAGAARPAGGADRGAAQRAGRRGGGAGGAARGGRGRRSGGRGRGPRRGAGDRHPAHRHAGGGGADRALRRPAGAPRGEPAAAEREPVADDAGARTPGARTGTRTPGARSTQAPEHQAPEHQAAGGSPERVAEPEAAVAADPLEAFRDLPRIVSLHQK